MFSSNNCDRTQFPYYMCPHENVLKGARNVFITRLAVQYKNVWVYLSVSRLSSGWPLTATTVLIVVNSYLRQWWVRNNTVLSLLPVSIEFKICPCEPKKKVSQSVWLIRQCWMLTHTSFFFCLNPRCTGNHLSGRGSGGHQRAEQQLLSGYRQEGGPVRSG